MHAPSTSLHPLPTEKHSLFWIFEEGTFPWHVSSPPLHPLPTEMHSLFWIFEEERFS